ncbi:hypothetical protein DERP_015254 [Dermatophagoides pteronyssinus]|uniref:Uncharacterized protein n=1 Tax=Dermatophagoides pteronyssinus TaxID=6956 RepID=A0ABQ8IVV5_DERPT|nr:hypothetical protein DERP_015254 [Dermatophagoides pteronyssinus]
MPKSKSKSSKSSSTSENTETINHGELCKENLDFFFRMFDLVPPPTLSSLDSSSSTNHSNQRQNDDPDSNDNDYDTIRKLLLILIQMDLEIVKKHLNNSNQQLKTIFVQQSYLENYQRFTHNGDGGSEQTNHHHQLPNQMFKQLNEIFDIIKSMMNEMRDVVLFIQGFYLNDNDD